MNVVFCEFKSEDFARFAKYEKQANPRLQFNIQFEGWRKWMVILYNLGFFKVLKWTAIGLLIWKTRYYSLPILKYGLLFVGGFYAFIFWLRFAFYRTFGAQMYEQQPLNKVFRTRFERIFKDPLYEQYSTHRLAYLICKNYFKWLILRPHRQWLGSIQSYLSNYPPITYYLGKNYSHGLAIRPLFVEDSQNGTFRGYFHWFVNKQDDVGKPYGMIEIECDGNLSSRVGMCHIFFNLFLFVCIFVGLFVLCVVVVNVTQMKLHVTPEFGGERLNFKPLKLSIDETWNAMNLDEGNYEFYGTDKASSETDSEFGFDNEQEPESESRMKNKSNRKKRERKLYQRDGKSNFLSKKRPGSKTIEEAEYTLKEK